MHCVGRNKAGLIFSVIATALLCLLPSHCTGSSDLQLTDNSPRAVVSKLTYRGTYAASGFDTQHLASTHKGFAFLSLNNAQVQILNLSNPAAPVLANTIVQGGESLRSTVIGDTFFSSAGSSHRLYISAIPTVPAFSTFSALLHNNTANTYVLDAHINTNYAYTGIGNDAANSSLTIWNVTNLSSPVGLSVFPTTQNVNRVLVPGNMAYLAEGTNGFHAVNVTNRSTPVHSAFLTGIGTVNAIDLFEDYVIAATSTGLYVIDVVSGATPVVAAFIATPAAVDVHVAGTRAYLALGTGGFRIYDVADILNPSEVISVNDGFNYKSCTETNGYAYCSTGSTGVRIFEVSFQSKTVFTDATPYSAPFPGTSAQVAIDFANGQPVILYRDARSGFGSLLRVKKLLYGSTWVDLGSPAPGTVDDPVLLIDRSDNKPFVIFIDLANGSRVKAKKWNADTTWDDLGFLSAGTASYLSAAIGPVNRPVIIFRDHTDSFKNKVRRWSSGTTWADLGNPHTNGLRAGIAVNSFNIFFVAIADSSGLQPLKGYEWVSGTTWASLGDVSTAVNGMGNVSMTVSPADDRPVVSYESNGALESSIPVTGGVVKRWNGSAWGRLGSGGGFSSSGNLVIDSGGKVTMPLITSGTNLTRIISWDGSTWTDRGAYGVRANEFGFLALDNSNRIFLIKDTPFAPATLRLLRLP